MGVLILYISISSYINLIVSNCRALTGKYPVSLIIRSRIIRKLMQVGEKATAN